jgi:hypothetical protein
VSGVNLLYIYSDMDGFNLQTTIVKEDSVSRQSAIHLFRYGWVHLHAVIVKENSQPSICYTSIQMWLDSLTTCNSKRTVSADNLLYIYSDMVGFTYRLQ